MEEYIDNQFDKQFEKAQQNSGLTWYPWVGKNYTACPLRVLVVGESHYDKNPDTIQAWQDPNGTRECIAESCIYSGWFNRTWSNLAFTLAGTSNLKKEALWKHIAYYNFVQRVMDYATQQERPNGNDFIQGWKSFIPVIETLKPDYCIFVGVTAANFFNYSMDELKMPHTPVQGLAMINGAYPRRASISVGGKEIPILFMKHCGTRFSWSEWHSLLQTEMPNATAALRKWAKGDD